MRWLIGIIFIVGVMIGGILLFIPSELPEVQIAEQSSVYPPFDQMIPLIRTEGDMSDLYLEDMSDLYFVLPDVGTEVQRETPDRDEGRVVRSASGKLIAFSTFDDPYWSVWIAESNGAESRLSERKLEVVDFSISPDDKALFLLEQGADGTISGSVMSIATRETKRIASNLYEARWLRDGRGIVYLTYDESEKSALAVRSWNLDGTLGEPTSISNAVWNVVGQADGGTFLVFAEFDGVIDLAELDSTGTLTRVGNLSLPKTLGISAELTLDGTQMVYTLIDELGGQQLFVYSLASKTSKTISEQALDASCIGGRVLYKEVKGSAITVMAYDLQAGVSRPLSEKESLTY